MHNATWSTSLPYDTILDAPWINQEPIPDLEPAADPAQALPLDLYTPCETAIELGIDRLELLRLVNRGDLAAYSIGGFIRFRQHEVHTLRDQRSTHPRAEGRRAGAASASRAGAAA